MGCAISRYTIQQCTIHAQFIQTSLDYTEKTMKLELCY